MSMKRQNSIAFAKATLFDIRHTSSHRGYIKATAKELAKFFGRPMAGEDKTTYEWHCKYGSVAFTVYDYKESVRPNQNTLVEYHIGTNTSEDTGIIVGLLVGLGLEAYITK